MKTAKVNKLFYKILNTKDKSEFDEVFDEVTDLFMAEELTEGQTVTVQTALRLKENEMAMVELLQALDRMTASYEMLLDTIQGNDEEEEYH